MKKYLQAVAIWFLIIPIAILNGVLREKVLIKLGIAALPLSGIMDLVKQYYFWTGNLWIVVVLSTLSAPILAGIIKKGDR